jgi:hypothetical protein
MIAEGVNALCEFSLMDLAEGWQSKDEVVVAVFRAMRQAQQENST